jgi:parallel beta-helix repeat protein
MNTQDKIKMDVNGGIKKMDKRYGILIVSVTIFVLGFVGTASATNWSVDGSGGADFTGIQDAINNASMGDTIIVHSGVYYENVVVDKSVTLKGIGYPIVDARRSGSAIRLTADGITLVGFTATYSGSSPNAGIKVTSNNNTLTGNNVSNNNEEGIILSSSSNNIITGNNVSSNGVFPLSSNGVGIYLYSSSNNTITGNNVNSNGVCFLSCNGAGIALTLSSNNTITGNNACNNKDSGISLWYSSNNTITGNNACNNNGNGFWIWFFSNNNTITGNNVNNNSINGIGLSFSSNNHIYLNNFISNTDNVYSNNLNNIWNSTEEMTYTYDGTTYESYIGNYWDDYEGTDAEGDGIGDTYYSIDPESDESDEYPLMKPFENYIIPTSAYT